MTMVSISLGLYEKAILYKARALRKQTNKPVKKCIISAIRELNLLAEVSAVCLLYGITVSEYVSHLEGKIV